MKKVIKIGLITIVVILAALISVPFIFKGKIVEMVKSEANKNINAKIDFGDFSLSLFRSFPDFSLKVENLSIEGIDVFEGDTLVSVPEFLISFDLMSVINGNYEIKTLTLKSPRIKAIRLADSTANWNITKTISSTEDSVSPAAFKIVLQKFSIENAFVVYDDKLINYYMELVGMNHELKGDFSMTETDISTFTFAKKLSATYGGIKYLNEVEAEAKADIKADLSGFIFNFSEADIRLNDLLFGIEGNFTMLENAYDLDLKFATQQTEFKYLLSLIPAIYSKDFDKIETSGKIKLEGYTKGKYSETELPAFEVKMEIEQAMFKYPELPSAVTNIKMNAIIKNPDGIPDHTIIDMPVFHLELAGNPIDISLKLRTPVSNPDIHTLIKGRFNLTDIKKFYPIDEDIKGLFDANFELKGKMSAIETGQYSDFYAAGGMNITDLSYPDKNLGKTITVSKAGLNFTPQYLELSSFDSKIGDNDFRAKGKITNYMGFFLKNEDLSGVVDTYSNNLNLNDFMTESGTQTGTSKTDTTVLPTFEVPKGIEFTMNARFEKLTYDKLTMNNVIGQIIIKDQVLWMKNLSMNTLGGQMTVSGSYDSRKIESPLADFSLAVQQVDIAETAAAFVSIEKFVPLIKKVTGKVSAKLDFSTVLGKGMMPVITSVKSGGLLETSQLLVSNLKTMDKIGDALKMDKLKKLELKQTKLSYLIDHGKLMVKPFDVKIGNILGNFSGTTDLENQSLDYLFNMQIPRSEMGSTANGVINGLVGEAAKKGLNINPGETINVAALITGAVKDPKVSTSLAQAAGGLAAGLKNQAEEEFNKKKAELEAQAKAELDAQKQAAEQRLQEEKQKLLNEADLKKKALEEKAKREADSLKKKGLDELKKKLKKPF